VCLSVGAKERGERGAGRWLTPFVAAQRCGREEKGAGGSGVRRRVEGKTGKREGAPGVAGDSSGGRH
jgi:hypothetical protein